MTNFTNGYISKFVWQNLSWYERDGLMTWLDQVKCDEVVADTDRHFNNTYIINFDKIHCLARGEKVPYEVFRNIQTIREIDIEKYPSHDQEKILGSAFRCERKDIFFEKGV